MRPTAYQAKPWYARWALWLRHKPIAFASGCLSVAVWLARGADMKCHREAMEGWDVTRWDVVRGAIRCHLSIADHRMGNTRRLDEIIADLERKWADKCTSE